jgi:hypothetical protein
MIFSIFKTFDFRHFPKEFKIAPISSQGLVPSPLNPPKKESVISLSN